LELAGSCPKLTQINKKLVRRRGSAAGSGQRCLKTCSGSSAAPRQRALKHDKQSTASHQLKEPQPSDQSCCLGGVGPQTVSCVTKHDVTVTIAIRFIIIIIIVIIIITIIIIVIIAIIMVASIRYSFSNTQANHPL